MSHYISGTDVTDVVARDFIVTNDTRLEAWLDGVDAEINGLALGHDVQVENILLPLNAVIKRYAVSYFCLQVFSDNIGATNVDIPQEEKYKIKYDQYSSICQELRKACVRQLFVKSDASIRGVNRISTGVLCRS